MGTCQQAWHPRGLPSLHNDPVGRQMVESAPDEGNFTSRSKHALPQCICHLAPEPPGRVRPGCTNQVPRSMPSSPTARPPPPPCLAAALRRKRLGPPLTTVLQPRFPLSRGRPGLAGMAPRCRCWEGWERSEETKSGLVPLLLAPLCARESVCLPREAVQK